MSRDFRLFLVIERWLAGVRRGIDRNRCPGLFH